MDAPLVSFAVFCCQQEPYVREAVRAAFAQDYPRLDVHLHDDGSTDGTLAILEEEAAAYRGPHTVRLTHSRERRGLAASLNRVMSELRGDFWVLAAGDDVSVAHRTKRLVERWQNERPSAISSNATVIDGAGNRGEVLMPPSFRAAGSWREVVGGTGALVGCAEAWDPDVFRRFGPLDESVIAEDQAMSLRAALLRGLAYEPEPLVLYRRHETNVTPWADRVARMPWDEYLRAMKRGSRMARGTAASWARDLDAAASMGLVARADVTGEIARLGRRAAFLELEERAFDGRGLPVRDLARLPLLRGAAHPKSLAKVALLGLSPKAAARLRSARRTSSPGAGR